VQKRLELAAVQMAPHALFVVVVQPARAA
jgi:hypothetical protein